MKIRKFLAILGLVFAGGFFNFAHVYATSYTEGFESFSVGEVVGQSGWSGDSGQLDIIDPGLTGSKALRAVFQTTLSWTKKTYSESVGSFTSGVVTLTFTHQPQVDYQNEDVAIGLSEGNSTSTYSHVNLIRFNNGDVDMEDFNGGEHWETVGNLIGNDPVVFEIEFDIDTHRSRLRADAGEWSAWYQTAERNANYLFFIGGQLGGVFDQVSVSNEGTGPSGGLSVIWPPAEPSTTYPFSYYVLKYEGDPIDCTISEPCAIETEWWSGNITTSSILEGNGYGHQNQWIYETNFSNITSTYLYVPSDNGAQCPLTYAGCLHRKLRASLVGGLWTDYPTSSPPFLTSDLTLFGVMNIPTSTVADTSTIPIEGCGTHAGLCDMTPPRQAIFDIYADCRVTSTGWADAMIGYVKEGVCDAGLVLFTMTEGEQSDVTAYVSGTVATVQAQAPFSFSQGPAEALKKIASTTATTTASLNFGLAFAAPILSFIDPLLSAAVIILLGVGIIRYIHIL